MTKRSELRTAVEQMLPEPVIIIGYLEHQLDLVTQVALDLAELVDETKLDDAKKARIEKLREVLQHSSVDFDNMEHPLQSYKLPKAVQLKKDTRTAQLRYQGALIREGLFE